MNVSPSYPKRAGFKAGYLSVGFRSCPAVLQRRMQGLMFLRTSKRLGRIMVGHIIDIQRVGIIRIRRPCYSRQSPGNLLTPLQASLATACLFWWSCGCRKFPFASMAENTQCKHNGIHFPRFSVFLGEIVSPLCIKKRWSHPEAEGNRPSISYRNTFILFCEKTGSENGVSRKRSQSKIKNYGVSG